jgi:hypothetical protein
MAEDPIDLLYGLPLEDFVARRDALAKEIRSGGDRERAAEIKKLPKPTRAAWAVNQLARSRPEEVRALVAAGAALAGAQEQLLDGADAAVLRSAAEAARALVGALAAEAPVDGVTRDKVRATLHAATVDEDVRAEVAAGRVLKERSASGFGGLEALLAAPPKRSKGRPDKREVRKRRDALRRANEAEADAESAVAGARRALEQVEATIAARRRDLDEAQAALSDARARRERAEQAAAEG